MSKNQESNEAGSSSVRIVKDVVDLADHLIKKVNMNRGMFLDQAQLEWSQLVRKQTRKKAYKSDQNDPDAALRMETLKRAQEQVNRNVHRNAQMPETDYLRTIQILEDLNFLREKRRLQLLALGKEELVPRVHPTYLSTRARLEYQRMNFTSGIEWFQKAIDSNRAWIESEIDPDPFSHLMKLRDDLDYRLELSRGLYEIGQFDEAVLTADRAVAESRDIDMVNEEKAFRTAAVSPKLWMPIASQACFWSCDARLHHGDWAVNPTHELQFKYRWSEAASQYAAPKKWLASYKIAAISDPIWCQRFPAYVELMAQDVFISLSPSATQAWGRAMRCWWAGFEFKSPKVSGGHAAIIVLAMFMTHHDIKNKSVKDALVKVGPSIIREVGDKHLGQKMLDEMHGHLKHIENDSVGTTFAQMMETEQSHSPIRHNRLMGLLCSNNSTGV